MEYVQRWATAVSHRCHETEEYRTPRKSGGILKPKEGTLCIHEAQKNGSTFSCKTLIMDLCISIFQRP
jgi:hypothetical protein